jgi:hypothetical protein
VTPSPEFASASDDEEEEDGSGLQGTKRAKEEYVQIMHKENPGEENPGDENSGEENPEDKLARMEQQLQQQQMDQTAALQLHRGAVTPPRPPSAEATGVRSGRNSDGGDRSPLPEEVRHRSPMSSSAIEGRLSEFVERSARQ